jgi:phosphatidylglycerophosphatase C
MAGTVVFDLDKVLLRGDATALFLRGRLRQAPRRAVPLLLAAPVLVPAALLPWLRPLAARVLIRLAVGADDDAVADGYREALAVRPSAAVADAIACVREHEASGDRVVVATGCEETLARAFLAAVGLGRLDVVGSTGSVWPPRSRRAMGETKVTMLVERGFPPPWTAVYSDSASDLPLFAGTARPVLVNARAGATAQLTRVLDTVPEARTWR